MAAQLSTDDELAHENVAPPEQYQWEYFSRMYDKMEDITLDGITSHHRSWWKMSKYKAEQMNLIPDAIWLRTQWYYQAAVKFQKVLMPWLPPMYVCYIRHKEYAFVRPIADKVMTIEHTVPGPGLIRVEFRNAFTSNIEVEETFHAHEKLIDAKDVAERVLRYRGAISVNTHIVITPKVSLTTQLRNIFKVKGIKGPSQGVKRRILKKTPSSEATSASFKSCACSGCVNLREKLSKAEHDFIAAPSSSDDSSDF
jgi:hypothetical protein